MSITTIALILLLLVAISTLFNYLFLKWTRTLGMKNLGVPEELRWSASYKPAIGGISFYIVFLISYLIYLFVTNPDLTAMEEKTHLGILIVVTIGFFTGLTDDAFNTVPWLKFSAQFACGLLLILFDLKINFFEVFWMDGVLTIFWTIAVMNSINMLDNMDGITTVVSITILAAAALCALPITDGSLFYTFICGGTVAALIGFLIFNWHPSKMFMGDTGSQMLGAMLAAVGIIFFWNNTNITADHSWWSKLAIVITAFVIPIADSLTVTINRIRRGQSPFVGGRDHTTHHLSYAGLTDRQVAGVMVIISLISLGFMAMLRYIPEYERNAYFLLLYAFSVITIVFLFSTTFWKKSRSVFRSNHMQSALK